MVKKGKSSSSKGKKKSKSVKVSKQKKVQTKVEVQKVEAEPVVVNEQSKTNSPSQVNLILESILNTSSSIIVNQKSIISQLKQANRLYKKELKSIEKAVSKARRNAKKDPNRPKRTPSGFAVPSKISTQMCDFLQLEHGTELSRTDITKKLTTYIREKNLQVPTNRRSFIPDNALGGILGPLKEVDQDKGYTYFNLQRYITPHIVSSSTSSA